LEQRLAPANCVWDGGSTVDSNWSTAANWVGDVAPVPGVDTLEFPATAARKANTNNFDGPGFLGIHFTGSGYTLGGSALVLSGDLSADPGLPTNVLNLSLGLDGDRTFQVGLGSNLTIAGAIGDIGSAHGFLKAGVGTLILRGANTYAGLTQVNEGLLRVENLSALGSPAGGTIIAKGAIIRLVNIAGPVTFPPEPLTFGPGPAGQEAKLLNSISDTTWSGPIEFEPGGNQLIGEPGKVLRITGVISGAGGFRHIASGGTIEFAGTAPNTYTGATQISRGTLLLHKSPGVRAVSGPLNIGGDDASAGVVELLSAEQIRDTGAVTLVGGSGFFGTLDLHNFTETIGSLSGSVGHVVLGMGTLITGGNLTSTLFGGNISGPGSVIKVGRGTLTLTGTSSYSGPTTIMAGILRVDGALTSAVTVRGGGTLSGSGTTGPATAIPASRVSPGTGPGILTAAGNVALGAGSTFAVELNGTALATGYDQLRVTGAGSAVSLGATLSIQLGFLPAGQSFAILDNGGSAPITGTFNGLPEGTIVRSGDAAFRITYQGGDGNDVVLTHLPKPAPGDLEWLRQFGSVTFANDTVRALAVDSSVYLAGSVDQALPGQVHVGDEDAFVRKLDAAGNELWTRQFGSSAQDEALGVAVDATGVYVVGFTTGTLPGQANLGDEDAFVRKYDAAGNLLWTRQFGTDHPDRTYAVAVDGTGVYVAGSIGGTLPGQTSFGGTDAFVRKYDAAGNETWTRQFGTVAVEVANAIAADATGVYVAGMTTGSFPGQTSAGIIDAFVRRYDAGGNESWTRQFGSVDVDIVHGLAVDGTGAYVTGSTYDTLPGQTSAGDRDAFVRKYDISGNEMWTDQFGSNDDDQAYGIAVDSSGVYVAGYSQGTLPGQANAGRLDAFVRHYDADGSPLWTREFGTSEIDEAFCMGAGPAGVYVGGDTAGTLPGQTRISSLDAFVRKLDASGGELWSRQFGSLAPLTDVGRAVAARNGHIYVAGSVAGDLSGQRNIAGTDAFVRGYDAAGNEVWTSVFGTGRDDQAVGIAVDAFGIYVVGFAGAGFLGQSYQGGLDAYVTLFDSAGNQVWTREFGTTGDDQARAVAVDASGIYVVGYTSGTLPGQTSAGGTDAFVRKYDITGNLLWTRQFGTATSDIGLAVAVDGSGVYVAGATFGTLPGQVGAGSEDAFVRKYDASGNELWTRQFGTSNADLAFGVAADGSGVYVAGDTFGALPGQTSAGGFDAYVRKYDASGNEVWTHQFGTAGGDLVNGVAVSSGGVSVVGYVGGSLPGQVSAGSFDVFVRQYDANGNELWTRQLGTAADDRAIAVAVDSTGLYLAGQTDGTFAGQTSLGGTDAFVAKMVVSSPQAPRPVGAPDDGLGSRPVRASAVRALLVTVPLPTFAPAAAPAIVRPPEECGTRAESLPDGWILEALAAGRHGTASGRVDDTGEPRPNEPGRVLDEIMGCSPDAAVLDELAKSLLGRSRYVEGRQPK
jgi:autotransporter-associated beta strand protein